MTRPLLYALIFSAIAACMPNMPFLGGAQKPPAMPQETASASDEPLSQEQEPADDFGKTCHKNRDCAHDACWVGSGELGYCTRFCNSFSDCPSFWECKKPGNAPQKICMQND